MAEDGSQAPAHLSPDAKAEWNRLIENPSLSESLGLENRAAIAIYCQNWARMAAAERHINEHGVVVPAPRTGAPMVNPHLGIATRAAEAVSKTTRRVGNGPGRGGPAKGAGGSELWGGPAKGAGNGPAKPFTADSPRPTYAPGASPKKDDRAARSRDLEDMLFDLATNSEKEDTRINAAVRLHAIWNGQPVAKNINLSVDDVRSLSDADLAAELARLGGAGGDLAAGDAQAGVPPEPTGILH